MGDNKRWKSICRVLVLPAVAVASLVACSGGGDDSSVAVPTQAPSTVTTERATVTLADYLLQRNQVITIQGFASPRPEELASIFDHSRAQAAAMMQGLAVNTNAIAVPPLRESFLRTVASAARGDTLLQLQRQYPADLGFYASASLTRGVDRRVWAQRDARFLPGFFSAIDSFGPLPPLGTWVAHDVGDWWDQSFRRLVEPTLASLGALNALPPLTPEDSGFWLDMRDLHPGLSEALPRPTGDTRLIVADALHDVVAWPDSKVFDGVYLNEMGARQVLPLIRFSANVKRHIGSDFRADVLRSDERWVLAIQPRSGTLNEFVAAGRLDSAVHEAVQALTSSTLAALPDGDIVLPVMSLQLAGHATSRTGLTLAFDEVNADLRGLDGGGTHLRAGDAKTQLQIGARGLQVHAAQVAAFTFSTKNRFVPDDLQAAYSRQTSIGSSVTFWLEQICPLASPDLRSFFLVVLDGQERVMALAALAALEGRSCY